MLSPLPWLAFGLAATVVAQEPGSILEVGDSLVSAMMMFVGNVDSVYILDKSEGNAATINGHPATAAYWDLNTRTATLMEILSNPFCASGAALPNGSFITFGGNGAIGPNGAIGSVRNSAGSGAYDATYGDYDGTKAIRVLNPCTSSQNLNSSGCQWYDNPQTLSMQKQRWYSTAETLPDGSVVMIGGFVNGGYVNRNFPNVDPTNEGGAAEPTYEFYPSKGPAQQMAFLTHTSGLNAYVLAWVLNSGQIFVQANLSTILWNYTTNVETPLPPMPNGVVRVYPASGGNAMLPMTPANNYEQTILFCGGSNMPADAYGNYSYPAINTWEYPASQDCQRITPEPADGSSPTYVQDDDMLEGRTMGQFILLPDGTMLMINGGANGTAGYAQQTNLTPPGSMPYVESLAAGPIGTPALYNPNAPAGSRWSNTGFATSNIARLYHSSAILLPDASVMIAGSNPNIDVNTSAIYPTTYKIEYFYPSYFSAQTRPQPTGVPATLSYGGNSFDITVPSNSYSGSANTAAANTSVVVIRTGFTTHGMNMGQRLLQLNNTYTVNSDGSIALHVSQFPPNPAIFPPGPALLFVVVMGIPSNATYVIVGNGQIGTQPTGPASVLPASVQLASASGSAGGNSGSTDGASHTGMIIGGIVGAVAIIGIVGALFGICLARRRRAANAKPQSTEYQMGNAAGAGAVTGGMGTRDLRSSDSSAFMPLQANSSMTWNASTTHLGVPYKDEYGGRRSEASSRLEYDPYSSSSTPTSPNPAHARWDGNGPMYEGPKY
ncbi:glyoxal oxidase [Piloderma croceum F 1598]|uniref:Glyoxal oxidase n=1 Tax=Piloderma croceum (strain F 1598) TaxID=765440 RepID=A0A0C3G4B1_PILCF|nr:glyoxal oxidase [Piloderma croceum F 1598]